MKIIERKISELIKAEYNPRKLSDKQFGELRDSLNRFGFVDPVLVNTNKEREDIIIGGHQRTKVWESMGNTTVPCVELDLTLDKEKELNIRLNKSGGEFDYELLQEHFEQDDLVDFGFAEHEFGMTLEDINSSDENDEWVGMPEFEEKEKMKTIVISFETDSDRLQFESDYKLRGMSYQKKTENAWSINYPFLTGDNRDDLKSVEYL